MKDVFYIEGEKKLIFRKEKNEYITFNPINLEFYSINFIGAEILYLIALGKKYNEIIDYFVNKYKINEYEFKEDLRNFINNFGCKEIIKKNLIELGIYLDE